ncbi:protein-disulfide reductase DsbD [Salinisphaera sp. T31B1]|uniref:protein-disulfide reductase DsbD n=1 Tax=Salinisphaera sp. T31B1 TaxID=727963 RepID=UPI00333EEC1F
MRRMFIFATLFATLLAGVMTSGVGFAQGSAAGDDFLSAAQAFTHDVTRHDDGTLTVTWDIAPGYYLYRHQFAFDGKPTPIAGVTLPHGKPISDEFFGDSEVYHDQVAATIDPGTARTIDLGWQGCAEAGLCYPPQHASIELDGVAATAGHGADQSIAAGATSLAEDQQLSARLADADTGWVLAVFFGLGVLLVFTPCVLPMLPILTSLIVGSDARSGRGFALSLAYVLPMAVVYALLGVAAALAGANLQAWLQTPTVLGVFAAIFIALALAMFGFYELQLPAPLRDRLQSASADQRGGSLGGAALMGGLSALVVGPCMTAPLAGALLYIADSGNVWLGGAALFSLGLGMGAPLVAVGSLGAHLLPRPGPWMTGVKVVFGFVLLGMALWFIARVIPDHWTMVGAGVLTMAAGMTLYQLGVSASSTPRPAAMTACVAGSIVGLWGGLLIIGGAAGNDSLSQPLAFAGLSAVTSDAGPGEAQGFMARFDNVADLDDLDDKVASAAQDGRWTLVDFYADWCVSCKVIEKEVFGDADVQRALADVELLRPDVTDNDTADRELMRRFGVVGPPTILLIGPDGRERRAARIVGELDAEAFLDHWARAHQSGGES